MGFFSRLSNGWKLAKTSLSLLNENRSLLILPVFSAISMILILSTFFGGSYFLIGDFLEESFADESSSNILIYGMIFIYYLINFFIITFFNTALIHCAVSILNGEKITISEGISFATSKLDKILGWSIVSATVGTLLNLLQNTGKIGEIAAAFIGVAWSVLTFFVVPILVYQDKGVMDSVKESGRIIKDKWGESLAGNFSFGIIYMIGLVAAGGIASLLYAVNPMIGIVAMVCMVLFMITVLSAAKTVFVAAVYNHTTERPVGNFSTDILDDIFMNKK